MMREHDRDLPPEVVVAAPSAILVDASGLAGFSYSCRPQCGLCCYAEPLVSPAEKPTLLRLVPEAEFVVRGRHEFVRSNPAGGACRLLAGDRCRAHAARPSPCREFPLFGHIGTRVQATVVLTCPGVDISALREYRDARDAGEPQGFRPELGALLARVDSGVRSQLDGSERRRLRLVRLLQREGRWEDEEVVRRRLRQSIPMPKAGEYPTEDPPSPKEGLERLPICHVGRRGPVAFARGGAGWELLELRPTGGVERSLGSAVPPSDPPKLAADAVRTLEGYLRYWLGRDQLFGTVHLAMREEGSGTVTESIAQELRRIGALTVSRAAVLSSLLRGSANPLTADDVVQGIRATDQDLLDRDGWGSRL